MEGFGGAPRFLAYPRAFTVRSGTDAVLSCQITGDPRPSILWEKDKTPIEPSGRFHVEAKGDLYSLLVSRATPQDSGLYVCKAKNSVGATYAAATLKVEAGEPQEEEGCSGGEAPAFLVAPSSTRVCRGEDVMFTCRVSGQPCPVLEWEKDGHKLSDIFESSHFAVGQEPEDWHFLKLFSARPPDGGVYVCRARSGSREALAAAVLLVEPQVPPDGLPNGSPADGPEPPVERQRRAKAFAVSVGKHAKFRCYVTGKPKPEIIWQKDGEALAPGRRHLIYEDREGYFILKVLYCKPQDQGLYVCTASNTAGQTLSAVQLQVKEHRLRFQVQLTDVEVAEREDAVLECQVPLETIPTAWYLEDRELQPSHKYVMEEQGVVRRLTIRDARTDDDGIYLCQMKDKGRSIAEVSVRGVIAKRLPRKLDVMEGENAVFCVETQEVVEGTCWSRDGLQLRESPHIVLKSFGRTHLLVLVHVTRQDAGIISFAVGESQTSSQLRVKCVKRDPPSAPVAAEMSVAESNAALLTWCPAPDAHLRPPSRYLLERREAVGGEWVQCLATDLPGRVRVLGDSVPREADYCFRICAANEHGRSSPVEFPGSVHLGEGAEPGTPTWKLGLPRGQPGCRATALSPAVLQPRQLAWRGVCRTHGCGMVRTRGSPWSCRLRCTAPGSSTVPGWCGWPTAGPRSPSCPVACGTRPRCTCKVSGVLAQRSWWKSSRGSHAGGFFSPLHDVSAPQVCIAPVPEAERLREVPEGLPVLLECQVSPPGASVCWLKDGEAVPPDDVIALQAEGCVRRLLLRSAGPSDTGVYTCDAGDDAVSFVVTVTEAPVRIISSNEEAPHAYAAGQRVELWCQLSRPAAPVRWYKDGEEVEAGENLVLEQEGPWRRLVLPCARPQDAGEFVCDAGGDSVFYTITVAEPPVQILQPRRPLPVVTVSPGETVTLGCELSRADAPVRWAKDGVRLEAGGSLVLEEEGAHRRLLIPTARAEHSGKYICDTPAPLVLGAADPPVRILERDVLPTRRHCWAMEDLVLEVHLSHAHGEVKWYKDGEKLQDTGRVRLEEDGARRSLVILGATGRDAGEYLCDTGDDSIIFFVTVEVPRVVEIITELQSLTVLEGEDATFKCLVSPEDVAVTWQLNGQPVVPGKRLLVTRSGLCHSLTLQQCQLGDAGTVTPRAQPWGRPLTRHTGRAEAQVLFVRKLRDVVAEEQGDVCLEVEVSHEAAEVQWLKQGVLLQPGSKYQLQESGCRRTLTIHCLGPGDRGTYRCESLHDRTQAKLCVEREYRVSIQTPLADVETFEKETATFHLELSHPGVPGVWTRDGIRVKPSSTCRISATGCGHSLTLEGLTLEDSGTVTFTADNLRCSARLLVREPPVAMVRVPRDLGVPETGVASFECELSRPSAEVKWFKVRVCPNCLQHHPAAGGTRTPKPCATRSPSPLATLAPCPSSTERQVRIVQDLQDAQVREGDNAVFTCEASHGDVKGEWFRDGEKIKVSGTVKIRQEGEGAGTRHFLLLCGVRPEDTGLIRFAAGMAVSEASLQVEALPIRIVKPLRDKTVLARHKATLECTVSHARGRVRWLRGDTEIFAGDKYEICNLDCYRTLIIHRVGPEDEDSYTCDAFDDRSTARLLVEGEGAPRGAPLGAGGGTMPHSRGTPGSLSPRPTACKGLSTGVGGAGWIWDQGLVPTLSGMPLSGAPRRSGDAAALPDSHCPHRELEARMWHSGAAHRQTNTTAGRWGHASPPERMDTQTPSPACSALRALH
uniref:Obscurin-like protein 1 n=1 Tax=Accipiter nisus TaxID=211598 RepID=A0A8B9NCF0_9AVES